MYTDPSGKYAQPRPGRDLEAEKEACERVGNEWNEQLNFCQYGGKLPPATNEVPDAPEKIGSPEISFPLLGQSRSATDVGVLGGLRQPGISREGKTALLTILGYLCIQSLDVAATNTQPKPRKHISLGLNDSSAIPGVQLLFMFNYNLNGKLRSQNIRVYSYGDWPSVGLSSVSTMYFEAAFVQATQLAEHIHFNLEGISGDPVVLADTAGPKGFVGRNFTIAELYYIRKNPVLCEKTSFTLTAVETFLLPHYR